MKRSGLVCNNLDPVRWPTNSLRLGTGKISTLWDYRAVLDITHFFALNFSETKITIEDSVSKLHGEDLETVARLAVRVARMSSMLEDKDCIIVGSPDVSDFAEIVLARHKENQDNQALRAWWKSKQIN
jgi:hypothetical protein